MSDEGRTRAIGAVVNAVRTAEFSAASRVATLCAEQVSLSVNGEVRQGIDEVRRYLGMQWPLTPVYRRGAWSLPGPTTDDEQSMQVTATFPGTGAAPLSARIVVSFAADDGIVGIALSTEGAGRPEPAPAIPPEVQAAVNNALANGTPIVVGYVDERGRPKLSPRGSTQCFSGTQLCLWARPASSGGLVASIRDRPDVSLLYRDSSNRSTLIIEGKATSISDSHIRNTVFGLAPEVEQNHDPEMQGTAIVIDVARITGSLPSGPVLVEPLG